jgi:hypothetical protein
VQGNNQTFAKNESFRQDQTMNRVEIRIKERINQDWKDWFEGLDITQSEAGGTALSGLVIDQASLYGLIARLRDLGLSISYLRCEDPEGAEVDQKNLRKNSEKLPAPQKCRHQDKVF